MHMCANVCSAYTKALRNVSPPESRWRPYARENVFCIYKAIRNVNPPESRRRPHVREYAFCIYKSYMQYEFAGVSQASTCARMCILHVQSVQKSPMLFFSILSELGFASKAPSFCREYLESGVPEFGDFPSTGIFPDRPHPTEISIEDVLDSSALRRAFGRKQCQASKDGGRDVYEAIMA